MIKFDYKFKAKDATTGEWVYGYLANPDTITIYTDKGLCAIDPDTICEFTGLRTPVKEKGFNNDGDYTEYQEIYEHDILIYNLEKDTVFYGGYCCKVPTKYKDSFIVRWTKSGFVLVPLSQFNEEKIKNFNENGIAPNTGYVISSYDTWNYHHYFKVIGNEFD